MANRKENGTAKQIAHRNRIIALGFIPRVKGQQKELERHEKRKKELKS